MAFVSSSCRSLVLKNIHSTFNQKMIATPGCIGLSSQRWESTNSSKSYTKFILSENYIDGKWTKVLPRSIQSRGTEKYTVTNPSNGEILGSAAETSGDDVQKAIDAAKRAFQEWSQTPARTRSMYLRRLFELQMANADALAELITREMGKPISEAKGEIVYGASFLEWFAEQSKRITGEVFESPFPDSMTMFIRQPIGPVGIITPWNFPNAMITRKVAAALAAGCTVVVRPSEDSPFSGLALGKLAEEAGIPPGVINIITSSRIEAAFIGKAFCESPDLAAISFTGSTKVGKILLSNSAKTVKRVCLELGGNAPFIVFESANISDAIQGCIASKFRNTGQTCVSSNVIYVHSSIHDEFVENLKQKMQEQIRLGDPLDPKTTAGPLVNSRAVEKVKRHVDDAVSKGAKIVIGGKVKEGNFFEPTILTGINRSMDLCGEETFGPVASIFKFDSEKDVIEKANNTRVGLAGYFYSNQHDQIWRVARALQVGMVGVNQGIISCCEAPFGGIKESGMGREGSHLGIEEFTNVKYICLGSLKNAPV